MNGENTAQNEVLEDVQAPIQYSWLALLSTKREQFVSLVRQTSLFNEASLAAFDQSKKPDGNYEILASDPSLLANAKTLINLLTSIEKLSPGLFTYIKDYLAAGNDINAEIIKAKLIGAGAWGWIWSKDIKELYTNIRSLRFHLSQTKTLFEVLPKLDHSFAPIVADLQNSLTVNIEPVIKGFQGLMAKESKPTEQAALNDAFNILGSNKDLFKNVYPKLEKVLKNLHEYIEKNSDHELDKKTELYVIEDSEKGAEVTARRAANVITHLQRVMIKVDKTINLKIGNGPQMLQDVGRMLLELGKIDFAHVTPQVAEELRSLLREGVANLEPLMLEMTKWMETSENHFNLRDDVLHDQFKKIYIDYINVANLLEVPLKYAYPYDKEKLAIQKKDLEYKKRELEELKLASEKLVTFGEKLKESDRLHYLVNLKVNAEKVHSLQASYYLQELQNVINTRTGMNDLLFDIDVQEKIMLLAYQNREQNPDALRKAEAELQRLYKIKHDLEVMQSVVAENEDAHEFSYNKNQMLVQPGAINLERNLARDGMALIAYCLWGATPTGYESTLEAANAAILAKENQCIALESKIARTEERLIAAMSSNNNLQLKEQLSLKNQIENLHPHFLFNHSIADLYQLRQALRLMNKPGMELLETLLTVVLNQRTGLDVLQAALFDVKEEIAARQAKISHNETLIQVESELATLQMAKQEVLSNVTLNTWSEWLKSFISDPRIEDIELKITECEQKKTILLEIDNLNETKADINKQISVLESALAANQYPENASKPYAGTYLDDFEEAKREALKASRLDILEKLSLKQEKQEDLTAIENEKTLEEFVILPQKTLIERLQAVHGKSALTQPYRDLILSLLTPDFLNPALIKAFKDEKLIDSLYGINVHDPLILKNIKAALNLLTRVDALSESYQVLFRTILNPLNNLGNANAEILAFKRDFHILQTEIKDFAFYMNQIESAAKKINHHEILPQFEKMAEVFGVALQPVKDLIDTPSFSKLLTSMQVDGYEDILKNLNTTAEVTHVKNEETVAEHVSSILQATLNKINELIKKEIGEEITKDKEGVYSLKDFKRKHPERRQDVYVLDLILLSNALIKLQKSLIGTMKMAEGQKLAGGMNVVSGGWVVYKALERIAKINKPAVRELKEIFTILHPLLANVSVQADLIEDEFGFQKGLLVNKVNKFCEMYEVLAENIGLSLESKAPYTALRIAALEDEKASLELHLDKIRSLERFIRNLERGSVSFTQRQLSQLIETRDLLKSLPPSTVSKLFAELNRVIEVATGQDQLRIEMTNVQERKMALEIEIAKKQVNLNSKEIEIENLEKNMVLIKHLTNLIENRLLFTIDDAKKLRDLIMPESEISELYVKLMGDQSAVLEMLREKLSEFESKLEACNPLANALNNELEVALENNRVLQKSLDDLTAKANMLEEQKGALRYDAASKKLYPSTNMLPAFLSVTYKQEMDTILKEKTGIENNLADIVLKLHALEEALKVEEENLASKNLTDIYAASSADAKAVLAFLAKLASALKLNTNSFVRIVKNPNANVSTLNNLLHAIVANTKTAAIYQKILDDTATNNPIEQAQKVAAEARKNTWAIGRFFRRLFGRVTVEDQLFYVASFFAKENNLKAFFASNAVASTSAISATLAGSIVDAKEMLKSKSEIKPEPALVDPKEPVLNVSTALNVENVINQNRITAG